MTKITAVIITKNEAHKISKCLDSVIWMNEVIVIDSGSTDGTQDICRKYGNVKLIETNWPGFGKQKQRAISEAKGDWVFLIDADEVISSTLKTEILEIINNCNDQYVAYKVTRKNFLIDKPIAYYKRLQNDSVIRLSKKGFLTYNDNIIHEEVIVDGSVGALKNYLLHYSFSSVEEMLNKMTRDLTLEAQRDFLNGKRVHLITIFPLVIKNFISKYFFKKAFLDGKEGLILAVNEAYKLFYRSFTILYLQQNKNTSGGFDTKFE